MSTRDRPTFILSTRSITSGKLSVPLLSLSAALNFSSITLREQITRVADPYSLNEHNRLVWERTRRSSCPRCAGSCAACLRAQSIKWAVRDQRDCFGGVFAIREIRSVRWKVSAISSASSTVRAITWNLYTGCSLAACAWMRPPDFTSAAVIASDTE